MSVWPLRIYSSRAAAARTVRESAAGTIHVHTLKSLPEASSRLPYASRRRAARTLGWNFSHSSSSGPCSDATSLPLAVRQIWISPFMSPVAHRSPAVLKAMAHTLS